MQAVGHHTLINTSTLCAEILNTSVELEGVSVTGPVKSGHVTIRSYLINTTMTVYWKATPVRYAFRLSLSIDSGNNQCYHFWPDTPLYQGHPDDDNEAGAASDVESQMGSTALPDVHQAVIETPVWLATVSDDSLGRIFWLVLRRSNRRAGAFERVGLLRAHHLSLRHSWWLDVARSGITII